MIEKITKRSGAVVAFDAEKIIRAIEKAFAATRDSYDVMFSKTVADAVIALLESTFDDRVPTIEDVQDVVERTLADQGFFDVAKSYILYRNERARSREQKKLETLERIQKKELYVRTRAGKLVHFDRGQIERAIHECASQYSQAVIHEDEIAQEVELTMYDGMSTSDINRSILFALRARIEKDPVYAYCAARFLANDVYKDVLGINEFQEGFEVRYREAFIGAIEYGIESKRYDQQLRAFDLQRLAAVLDPTKDQLFQYMGMQTLYDRYFMRDHNQKIFELPQHFWMRVAMGLSLAEDHKTDVAIRFYHILSALRYTPSTPTLLHAGTQHPQMSSCYITTVEDDLSHIFKCIGDNAQLAKWSGGVGNDWTNIRATGARIASTNVGSQGLVPFLKIVDSTTAAINRSGKRRGATCVYVETWHYDVEDFLELKRNTGDERRRTHDINTAHWIPDLFMKRVAQDGRWTLFSPEEVPDLHNLYGKKFERRYEKYERMADEGKIKLFKVMQAADLMKKMITMLYETGHPWFTFKDPCNIRSPQDHVGVVHSSNLCTEITLNTSKEETAVCNLGSVNISRHIVNGMIDWDRMQETVALAVRMLDNVIDPNFYPTPEARHANLKHRPIGLGIMGFQDALYALGMSFDSEQAVELSDRLMEFISYHAILTSSKLAQEKGTYESYQGSKWDRGLLPYDTVALLEAERGMSTDVSMVSHIDWTPVREHIKQHGMRNSNCMAIAPTATIANIAGCLPSIEPIYKNLYVKSNFSGEFTVINDALVHDLKELGLWNDVMLEKLKYYDGNIQRIDEIPQHLKDRYKETFEIDPSWIIMHAARRGKWIDQSQSINIFTASESGKFIANVYMMAWNMGLKTTYYLRTLAASGIEKSTIDINKNFEPLKAPSVSAPAASTTPSRPRIVVTENVCEGCQ